MVQRLSEHLYLEHLHVLEIEEKVGANVYWEESRKVLVENIIVFSHLFILLLAMQGDKQQPHL